ncbi:hypothetical protein SDC9_86941 [bioreactor metagenome]|uniref:Uncharacterized protein n=1 Tax=bioreactor metagenome TaxID=1076179 RepID=A0A644ZKB4_9ZZZZ
MGNAVCPHLSQIVLDADCIWRSQTAGERLLAGVNSNGTDKAAFQTGMAEDLFKHIGYGCFAICSSHANDGKVMRRVAEKLG